MSMEGQVRKLSPMGQGTAAGPSNPARPSAATLNGLNRRWEQADVNEILRWAIDTFEEGRLAITTSFGPAGIVILHHLQSVAPDLPVVFIDTLHHFPETLELVERIRQRMDLNLQIHRPAASRATFEALYGSDLHRSDVDRYQRLTKQEPALRAARPLEAWITGRRREQTSTRATLPILEAGERLIKINPLAAWSLEQVWAYLILHELPYNPLHDQGYASIGDEPLTSRVSAGEVERAGRWRGSERLECGMHEI